MRSLFLFFITLNLNAQILDNLKFRDTIYIMFDQNEKFDDLHLKSDKTNFSEEYTYLFPDAKHLFFQFISKKKEKNDWQKKKELKNKVNVLNIHEIREKKYSKIISIFTSKKPVIYLIDNGECRKKKCIVRRVFLGNIIESIL